MTRRRKSLIALVFVIIIALISFGLTTYFKSTRTTAPKVNSQTHLQEVITGAIGDSGLNKTGPLPSTPVKKTPPQYADKMSVVAPSTARLKTIVAAALTTGVTVTPSEKAYLVKEGASGVVSNSITIGIQRMDGFTTNWSWQGLKLRIGWTIQPNTVRLIDSFIRGNPYYTDAQKEMIGAMACGSLLTGLGNIVCSVIFSVFTMYVVNVIHSAAVHWNCVTIKTYLPVLGVFNPLNPLWDAFPYEDPGDWCHKEVYSTPPKAPNPQGPRTPGDCNSDPTRPGCNV